jgi:excinuclease ABC subunit C
VKSLHSRMQQAAEDERFEDAARLRDRIAKVENTLERQQIVSDKSLERDVFGLARQGGEVEIQVLHVREGRVMGAEDYGFSRIQLDDGEVMSSFLGQYYGVKEGRQAPREVLCSTRFEDGGALAELLEDRWQRAIHIRTPSRGGVRKLVEIAGGNAKLALQQRLEARESVDAALAEVEEACALSTLPRRIECYDVSNLQGSLAVASRVVFEDGLPSKQHYRRYRIKHAAGDDDYDCLREVMRRRLARVEAEPLPDLLMVDGGRGQLGVVTAALADAELVLDCLGISKQRDEESPSPRVKRSGGLKAERLYRPGRANPILLAPSSRGLLLLQRVRDESHRFAIDFQRELRSKIATKSILEELPGIGPKKRRTLLRSLGSLRAVREAAEQELREVEGISARDAATIYGFFRPGEEGPERAEEPEGGRRNATE